MKPQASAVQEPSKTQCTVQPAPASASRNTSPAPSPISTAGLGRRSVLAKQATSYKLSKLKNTGGSRASSTLANPTRATSPQAPGPNSHATSPVALTMLGIPKTSTKRKADEAIVSPATPSGTAGSNETQAPKAKKRKAVPSTATAALTSGVELREDMLVDWIRKTPNATTRDCIQYFRACLTDESQKKRFTAMVKDVAFQKQGILVLRDNDREPGAMPAPA